MSLTQRIVIHGRVQGVGYRDALCAQAQTHRVAGWVRNRRDGSVEAVLHGAEHDVQALIVWAHRGPPAARVDHIDITPHCGTFASFERRPTA